MYPRKEEIKKIKKCCNATTWLVTFLQFIASSFLTPHSLPVKFSYNITAS